ncbi:hypothetical protein GS504_03410 [Rhodococcus hoagii]|nr:hypothetical protein [Prescottella equi]NKS56604.1 hypothetical protein [Prescottella equi]
MAEALAEKFSYGDTADAVAERLSCCEVDALAEFLRATGRPRAADSWIQCHAPGDDEGDSHYLGDPDA